MQITLIRHGQTPGNALHRYIGSTDEPLSEEARQQMAALFHDHTLAEVYVSPLIRTRQTAGILFPDARQIVVDDLREMDFGDFENRSYRDMEHDSSYRSWVAGNCLGPCPHGESRALFSRRVCHAFSALVKAQRKEDNRLVFVVHGGTIMAILEQFSLPHRDFYAYSLKNCQGFVCDVVFSPSGDFSLTAPRPWEAHL